MGTKLLSHHACVLPFGSGDSCQTNGLLPHTRQCCSQSPRISSLQCWVHNQEAWSGLTLPSLEGERIAVHAACKSQVVVGDIWILPPFQSSPHWEDKHFCYLSSFLCTPGSLLNAAGALDLPPLANSFCLPQSPSRYWISCISTLSSVELSPYPFPLDCIYLNTDVVYLRGGGHGNSPWSRTHWSRYSFSQPFLSSHPHGYMKKKLTRSFSSGAHKSQLLFANIWS